jgi:hypothetical protein
MSPSSRVLNTFRRTDQANIGVAVIAAVGAVGTLAYVLFGSTTALDRVIYGVVFLACAVGAVRSCVVVQAEDQVIVRQTQWNHRLPKQSVRRFSVESGSVRTYGRRARYFLVAELVNGNPRAFKEFNGPKNEAGEHSLDEVSAALNAAWHLD